MINNYSEYRIYRNVIRINYNNSSGVKNSVRVARNDEKLNKKIEYVVKFV
jgi:hypothetical protein